MRIICAWCSKDMGEKFPFDSDMVTHGICDECVAKISGAAQFEISHIKLDGETVIKRTQESVDDKIV